MSRDKKSSYYDAGGIEVLDIIKAKLTSEQYQGYLLGNAIKYQCRLMWKHTPEERKRDAEKSANYSKWLNEELSENIQEGDNGCEKITEFNILECKLEKLQLTCDGLRRSLGQIMGLVKLK